MDLSRALHLAGLLAESKTTLEEGSRSFDLELHYSPKGLGNLGDIYVFMGKGTDLLASLFGIADGWKEPKKVFDGLYGSYNAGDRLVLFKNAQDWSSEEDEQDED